MANGISSKTDIELFISKESSRRSLKHNDIESGPSLKGNHSLTKELDVLSNLTSKKTSEDHNLNELDKMSVEGSHKTGKGGQQHRATFGVFSKSSKKIIGKSHEKVKEYEDDEENDESDSDSLSASSSSISNSRKNSRSNSPKVN